MALLVALAILAERVAARSFPVRCLALWVLQPAEAVAARFVFEATGAPAGRPILTILSDPADADRLAARFHALALALGALLAVICRSDDYTARPARASGHISQGPGGHSVALGGWTPEPIDTS